MHAKRGTKQYHFNDLAGCVEQRRPRGANTTVGVYNCVQAQIDDGGSAGDPLPWATVCERHGVITTHRSLPMARNQAADPLGWCDQCREEAEAAAEGGAE